VTRAVRFHRLAELELNEAAEYFDREYAGLGSALLSAVERCVQDILQFPESGTIVSPLLRRRLVRRFPYSVLYEPKPGEVRVLAIMHAKRRPNYWANRS